jgi:hydrogenase/urease accessory protein HupE
VEVQERRQRWRTVQLLAVAMLVVGTAVAVAAAKRGQVPELPPPLEFLAVPLGNLAIFAVLVAVGLYNRRKRDSHKRLMMLSDRDSGRRARSPLVAY